MKDEIIGGLKNALERGESLESSINSFIAAGYNRDEVRAAAAELSRPEVSEMEITSPSDMNVPSPSPSIIQRQQSVFQNQKSAYDEMIEDRKRKTGFRFRTFLIIFIIFMLIMTLSSVVVVLAFPEVASKIISFLSG